MTDLRELKFERQPEHTEGSQCTCASPEEHEAMVREVQESFKRDDERARMRIERNATFLSRHAEAARVQANGHVRRPIKDIPQA